jgi:RHS repeat-associated protein
MSGSSLYVQSTQYDAAGRLELRLLGADQVRIDPYYRPWDTQGGRMHWLIGRVGSAGAFLQALEYAYDAVGNVSWIKDNLAGGVQTQSFSYDAMDRLLSAGAAPAGDGGDYSESYSYDSAGRLVNGPRGNGYVYADAAHKHAVTSVSGGHSYAYDANGNLVSRTSGGQTLSFVYDAENRLVGVSGAVSAAFVYDGDGRRVKGTVNGVTTYYVGDHYEVSGGVVKKYYSAGGQHIAMRSGGTLYWLLNDHLGGTAHTISGTTETGEVRYRAFGVTRFASGTTPTTYRFTGQREEAALGLYYYNARWYDPVLGRFIQPDTLVPDPADARMFDRYAYVNNNPLLYNDPSGHCAVSAVAGPSGLAIDVPCWSSGAGAALTAGAAAAISVSAGGLYAAQWAMEDPLPSIPPLYPSLAPDEGNISVTIPVPGSTTVISGVPLIPTLDTTDPGVTPIETPGLNITSAKPGPKPWPEGAHNQTIARRVGELQRELGPDWEHEAGGPLTEEVINIPLGGHRSQRRPDITFRNWITGEYYRENVGRIYSNGQPIRREVEALDDLERATGQRPGYTPYD